MESKPIHAKPSLYGYYFEIIKEIGLKYGYNIVLHGSMNRDLDLIAIPWQELIGNKIDMVKEIAELIGGCYMEESEEVRELKRKPHGREVYIININRSIVYKYNGIVSELLPFGDPQYYIDISIILH